jgi:hypothetical protein
VWKSNNRGFPLEHFYWTVYSWLSVCRLSGLWLTHVPLRSICNPVEHLPTSLSLSVQLSVHMKHCEKHRSALREIWYWRILWRTVIPFQF